MKPSEQIEVEYDKADALSGRCDIPRDTLLGWKNEVGQLEDAVIDLYKQRMGLSSTIKLETGLFAYDLYVARRRKEQPNA